MQEPRLRNPPTYPPFLRPPPTDAPGCGKPNESLASSLLRLSQRPNSAAPTLKGGASYWGEC